MDDLPADRRYIIGDGEMTARILCLIVLLLEIRGLSLSLTDRKWMVLIFYTQLSNLVTTASALLLLIFGQPYAITILRYISTCMLVMTFFVTTCVLIPMGGDPKKLLWSGNGPYPFFRVHNQSAAATVLWMAVLFAAVTAISTAVWAISR